MKLKDLLKAKKMLDEAPVVQWDRLIWYDGNLYDENGNLLNLEYPEIDEQIIEAFHQEP